jgi:hypothetical protein
LVLLLAGAGTNKDTIIIELLESLLPKGNAQSNAAPAKRGGLFFAGLPHPFFLRYEMITI